MIKIKGKFVIPSGVVATTPDILKKIALEIPEIGILTTKSITLMPQQGNPEPIIYQTDKFSFINAVGLTNPGAKSFAKELGEIYPLPNNKFLLISIAGSTVKEFQETAKILSSFADGFELNFSCPHAKKGYGMAIGQSKELTEEFIKGVKKVIKKPVFVKLTPNVEDIGEIAKAAVKAGADGISAINTVGPRRNKNLSYGKGGVSGRAIKKTGIDSVREISQSLKDYKIPIIAIGGIKSAKDIELYQKAGADFFGIGSALTAMSFQEIKKYFKSLKKDVRNNTNYAERLVLNQRITDYKEFKIKTIQKIDKDLRIFYFNKSLKSLPGQFVFLSFDKREKPFSIAYDNPLILVARKVGPFTSKIFKLKKGDRVRIKGPYGRAFEVNPKEKTCLVGGGTGTAPLYFLSKKLKNPVIFLGGKTKKQILFKNEFKKIGKVYIATQDGSEGYKGLITDCLKKHLKQKKPLNSLFYNCGPELMMKKAIEIEKDYTSTNKIFASIERYTKCGIGLCGSCAINGYRACVDGPVFTFLELNQFSHFGKQKRDKFGKLTKL